MDYESIENDYWEDTYGYLQPENEDYRDYFIKLAQKGVLRLCDYCLKSKKNCHDVTRKGHGRRGRDEKRQSY